MSKRKPKTTAVALRYDNQRDETPRIIAKGKGSLAEEIVTSARRHGIPIHEHPKLAEALAELKLESEIPPIVFQAVAEVLAFVYSAGYSK